jgi:hypothetical protein
MMLEEADPILVVVAALAAAGVEIVPIGEELEHWRIGDFIRSDADVWRLAASRGLVEADERR